MDLQSNKVFRLVVNFVYEEILNQFIISNGQCSETTFSLINWNLLIGCKNKGFYGKLETNVVLKCYLIYLINLFSIYLKTNEIDCLLEIQKVLSNEKLIFSISCSFAITFELKFVCYKTHPLDNRLNELLANQDFIQDIESYSGYSNEKLYSDLCVILKRDDISNKESILKKLVESTPDVKIKSLMEVNNENEISKNENADRKRKLSNDTCSSDELNEQKENQVKKKKMNRWSSKETLYLVYLVHKVGRSWVEILSNYEKYFENRTAQDLCNKYVKLEKDTLLLEQLRKKGEILLKDEIKELAKKTINYGKWDDDEVICLIKGVELFGRNWNFILNEYKNKFKQHRECKGLHSKYKCLENNKESLEYFKKLAGII